MISKADDAKILVSSSKKSPRIYTRRRHAICIAFSMEVFKHVEIAFCVVLKCHGVPDGTRVYVRGVSGKLSNDPILPFSLR